MTRFALIGTVMLLISGTRACPLWAWEFNRSGIISSQSIVKCISDRLQEELVDPAEIQVTCQHGVVKLNGEIACEDLHHRVVEIASHMFGVVEIDDQLLLRDKSKPVTAAEVVERLAVNNALAETVARHLRRASLVGFGIQIECRGGVITLIGKVDDISAQRLAAEVTKAVPGVHSVTNNLTLRDK
jgi:osmotically-inducible protein OsmY